MKKFLLLLPVVLSLASCKPTQTETPQDSTSTVKTVQGIVYKYRFDEVGAKPVKVAAARTAYLAEFDPENPLTQTISAYGSIQADGTLNLTLPEQPKYLVSGKDANRLKSDFRLNIGAQLNNTLKDVPVITCTDDLNYPSDVMIGQGVLTAGTVELASRAVQLYLMPSDKDVPEFLSGAAQAQSMTSYQLVYASKAFNMAGQTTCTITRQNPLTGGSVEDKQQIDYNLSYKQGWNYLKVQVTAAEGSSKVQVSSAAQPKSFGMMDDAGLQEADKLRQASLRAARVQQAKP